MNTPLKLLTALMISLLAFTGMARSEKLNAEDWEAEMKIANELQRDAMEIRNRVKELRKKLIPLEEEAMAKDLATIEEIEKKEKKLFTMVAERMTRLSGQTNDAKLSALCTLRAGQNHMRAENYPQATKLFDKLAVNKELEDELRAQALYWNALSHEKMVMLNEAKRLYKAITFEFPESKWAKYARGRLTDPVMH